MHQYFCMCVWYVFVIGRYVCQFLLFFIFGKRGCFNLFSIFEAISHNFVTLIQQIEEMGNKIGLQIAEDAIKIVYSESISEHIDFMRNLKSKYLVDELEFNQSVFFLFQCPINQFLIYHTTKNVALLRKQYEKLLGSEQLIIKTNRQTINKIQKSLQIKNALEAILLTKFSFRHAERIETSIKTIRNLHQKNWLFTFKKSLPIIELANFGKQYCIEKQYIDTISGKYLLVSLRNGISFFTVQEGNKIQRLNGSIIGEKTIKAILNLRNPSESINQIITKAFQKGKVNEIDLLVSDIYGNKTDSLGLPGDLIASSMGKLAKMDVSEVQKLNEADISRSILTLFGINTGIHISLELKKQSIKKVLISADFFHNDFFYCIIECIVQNYAGKDREVYFCKYSPFLGCLGTAIEKQ